MVRRANQPEKTYIHISASVVHDPNDDVPGQIEPGEEPLECVADMGLLVPARRVRAADDKREHLEVL